MNKTFSKVWSKRLGHLVVASEHARLSGGKSGGVKKAASALLLAGSGLLTLTQATAATQEDVPQPAGTADDTLQLGDGIAVQTGNDLLAIAPAGMPMLLAGDAGGIAPRAMATSPNSDYFVVDNNGSFKPTVTDNTRGIAAGYGTSVSGDSAGAFGRDARANGASSYALGHNVTAVGNNSVAIGSAGSKAEGNGSVAIGQNTSTKLGESIAAGSGSKAHGQGAAAFGGNAAATADGAVALGYNSKASAANGVGIGEFSVASGIESVAIGVSAAASAEKSLAIGSSTFASGASSIAIGDSAKATGTSILGTAVAIGRNAKAGLGSLALGENSDAGTGGGALAGQSVALGKGATATGGTSFAGGYNAKATNTYSLALGQYSEATGDSSVTLGHHAVASADNSTALGSSAKAESNDSVAVGRYAKAQAINSVALGQGSVSDRADTVSVGNNSQKRQVTNMAAGTANTDAVNVSQLKGVVAGLGGGATVNADGTITAPSYSVDGSTVTNVGAAISNLDGRTMTNTTNISNLTTQINSGTVGLVQQSAAGANLTVGATTGGAAVDFTGTGGARTLTGVKAGGTNTDAVNVSQLKSVVAGLGGGAMVNTDGTIATPLYSVDGSTVVTVGAAITNLDGRTTTNTTNISNLTTQINSGTVGLVQQSAAGANLTVGATTDGAAVDFTGTDGARTLTGVKAGGTNTDAVNVSQLKGMAAGLGGGATVNADGTITAPSYTINGNDYDNVGGALGAVNTSLGSLNQAVTSGGVGVVQRTTNTNETVLTASGASAANPGAAQKLSNLAAGTVSGSSLDAINGAQLHGVSTSVASTLGGGSVVNADGTVTAPSYSVDGSTVTNVGAAISNLDGRTTTNTTNISNLTTQINSGTVGLVQQSVAGTNLTVGATTDGAAVDFTGTGGARTLTGVKAGGTNTDAVNVSQLKGVVAGLGGGATVNADGTITAPSYSVDGSTVTNVGAAISNLDGRTTTNTTNISNLTTQINSGTVGLVQQSAAGANLTVGATTDGAAVDFTGTSGARTLTGVKAGGTDTDAVNVSQLKGVAAGLGGGATVNADGTITAPSYSVDGSTVTNVGAAISNLDGRTTTNTTNIATNTTNISNLTTQINSGTVGLVQQSATGANLTVGATTDGAAVDFTGTGGARMLSGVKAGSADTDAVNVAQLKGVSTSVAGALGGGSVVNADGTITAPSYSVDGSTVTNVGAAITNLDGRTTTNTTNIATNTTNISNLTTQINSGTVGLVQQSATGANLTVGATTDGAAVDFTGTGGVRTLTGVKAGTLSSSSTEAVNGAQLFATNARVGSVEQSITDINNSLVNGAIGLVKQDEDTREITVAQDSDGKRVNFSGSEGTRVLDGVAAGAVNASSQQAVNGAQLYGVSSSLANAFGGGSAVNADGSISAPSYSVGGSTVNNVGAAISNLDGRTTQNSNDIADLKNGMGDLGGDLTGIKNNINTINNSVENLDGRVTHLENTITNGGFSDSGIVSANVKEGGKQVASAAGENALTVGNAAQASGNDSVALGNDSHAKGANSVALGNGSIADRDNSVSVGSQGGERQVTHVAAGTQDTDAVNVAQLSKGVASANSYTDTRVQTLSDSFDMFKGQVDRRFSAQDRRIDRQGAMSAAMMNMAISAAGIRTENRVGVGVGYQNGEGALSVGYQRAISDRATVTIGGAFSNNERSIGAGAGFGW